MDGLDEYTSDLRGSAGAPDQGAARARPRDRSGDAHERGARRVLRRCEARHPAPPGSPRWARCSPPRCPNGMATAVGGMTMGADPRRLCRPGGGSLRKGVLRAQGDQGAWSAAAHRGSAAGPGGSLRGRRGRRHHGRLDARCDRGAAGRRPDDLRCHQRARPARRRRRRDRAGRGRAVRVADARSTRSTPSAPIARAPEQWRRHEPPEQLLIRAARPGDEALLLELFGELAEYEHLEHELRPPSSS